MEKKKLTPQLRFPEFKNAGEWEERTIEDIVIAESSTLALNKLNLKSNGYPIYGADGIIGYIDDFQQIDKYISIVKDGSGVGRLALCEGKSSILGTLQYLKSRNPEDYDLTWVYYLLNTVNFSSFIKGSGIPHIYYSDYKNENIALPSLPEQQKIASCLSSLDEVIELHTQKLELLQEHKKGLLQNLFPQEGETVPRVRFPEFEGDGEWVEDDIGTLFKFKQGVQVPVSNQFPEQGDDMVRFIRIIDITSNNEPPRYIQHPGDSHIISKDDLFMIRYGTPGLISIGFEGVIANNLFRLIWKSEKRNQPKFWFYAFQRLESFIYNLSSSSSMPAISFSTLEGLKIGFPPTIEEQQKIASCLSALDELITSQQEKIDQLQQHKKGLMQGLFPSAV